MVDNRPEEPEPEDHRSDGPELSFAEAPDFSLPFLGARPRFDYARILSGILIGLIILSIAVFSLTDLSATLLPMDDLYLNVLRPTAEDGSPYAFVLNELINELDGRTLTVSGRMTNDSTETLEDVLAVISIEETTGRFPATLEIPIDPSPLEPGESGIFSMSVTLRQAPYSYRIKFKLQHGPFVLHRDERGFGFETIVPDVESIAPIPLN